MLAAVFVYAVSLLHSPMVTGLEESFLKSGSNQDYDAAIQFLWKSDALLSEVMNKEAKLSYDYATNLTEENRNAWMEYISEWARVFSEIQENATSFAWKDFKDKNETVYRWFKELDLMDYAALPEVDRNLMKLDDEWAKLSLEIRRNVTNFTWKDFKNENETVFQWFKGLPLWKSTYFPKVEMESSMYVTTEMEEIYVKAKVCSKDNLKDKPCDLSLEPELTEIFKKSTDPEELKRIWKDWRDATGRKMKLLFKDYVKFSNEEAKFSGYNDFGEQWRDAYEVDSFQEDIEELWKDLEPLYKQLHAYVRRKLIQRYPDERILPHGPIPAHLLGEMWAKGWQNIYSIVKPFPNKEFPDVSQRMKSKKMTPLDMFKLSEEFFTSLGLKPMTPEFWRYSVIEKPADREMNCHGTAWDLYDGKDFRISLCASVDMEYLIAVLHEMGHVQYFMEYAHQPVLLRDGANPGFHEAIGDAMALSFFTSDHLRKIGFMNATEDDNETEINSLMMTALEKVAFLPFGYLVDSWRWKVFSGEYFGRKLNLKWWEECLKYQGICPPVKRTSYDLDAASIYHVTASVPYIRYFVSNIVEFQFHKALCDAAGYIGPLHECNIYQSKEAGKLLSDMLSLGASRHWTEAMKIITRGKSSKLDAQPLMDYFKPLIQWLEKENEGEIIGWQSTNPMECPRDPFAFIIKELNDL